ncbi:pyruvate, phosphate dikinase [Amycolatopsis sp. K13G38]|uniref:Pyruvate, phosphate dikinase n=1 Tax=Amycolatopsis acididurans TaxID=2724524 RepID=A0ABX1JB82_9PSEU|nr:pyruvate, phosphate dikinase [Amycolatopsis acididurans]NKQ57057.1 pyruvate, phosphate dikinase [Amycolatopsis acididurans]
MILLEAGGRQDADRTVLGGKAFSINRMLRLGLPVPPAFVFPTSVCVEYYDSGKSVPAHVAGELREGIASIEAVVGRRFGDLEAPLLVSVRSGAARSMPGMMDTVLNLGVNPEIAAMLSRQSGDQAFGADTHRRFVQQFTHVVGKKPTDDPWEQLEDAVVAVFESWNSPRATAYRRHHGLPDDAGTAVTVQAMVFGNLGSGSGTGVLFSRNPVTGDAEPYGEWLPGGQGEDVVSGRFDPLSLSDLADSMPAVHDELLAAARVLEREFGDVQDIEFTVERGRLWLLQARSAKRSATAAVRHAVAMRQEGLLTVEEALERVTAEQLGVLLAPHLSPEVRAGATLLAKGEVACPGVASGVVVTSADEADELAAEGKDVVLATPTTNPDDVHGMLAARAIVTEIGGATSHAAVVSRELGRPCVVGCGEGILTPLAGRVVTVDSTVGEIFDGALPLTGVSGEDAALETFCGWVRQHAEGWGAHLIAAVKSV